MVSLYAYIIVPLEGHKTIWGHRKHPFKYLASMLSFRATLRNTKFDFKKMKEFYRISMKK